MTLSSILFLALALFLSFSSAISHLIHKSQANPARARDTNLNPVSRTWIAGGPCKKNDYICMNRVGLVYVNQIRKKAGKNLKSLAMGTVAMRDVAMAHSKRMYKLAPMRRKRGKSEIFHQKLDKVKLGCNSYFTGENVGFNFIERYPDPRNLKPTDPAKKCVRQFYDSPPHLANMLSEIHKDAVLGVFVDKDNFIWCTQIFAVRTRARRGKCKRLNLWDGGKLNMWSERHVFRKLSFIGRFPNGRVSKMVLTCRWARCRYCQERGKMCISEEKSVQLDVKYFS